jgi:HK97 gp10 family phage protein
MAKQAFSFQVDFSSLEKMLTQLPKAMGKAVLRNALKKAAKPTLKEAEATAPSRGHDKSLSESFVISTKLNRGQRQRRRSARRPVEVFVGSTHPNAYQVEWGTGERVRKSGGETGSMPASPFFTRAWDATKNEALRIMVKEIEAELMKAAKRLAARAEKGTLGKKAREALL